MEWRDEGIIIGLKRHGESSAIVELMTRGHGRHLGIVRGGRSRRMQMALQPGSSTDCLWRARLEEHLGVYTIEITRSRAADIMESPLALHGINLLGSLLRLLPERDPHPALYDAINVILGHLADPAIAPVLMVRFELAILAELGFGLDLSCCAATGRTDDLVYVSPKSGRAVNREAGEPWRDRLLALPGFMMGAQEPGENLPLASPHPDEVRQAFVLTGFFLERDVFRPRGLPVPEARNAFMVQTQRGASQLSWPGQTARPMP